ncbi:hypothetical protein HK096_002072, partial [Nowakowskiella sp. JEL0078]
MISEIDGSVLKKLVSLNRLKIFQQRSKDIAGYEVAIKGITLSVSNSNIETLLGEDCCDLNVLQGCQWGGIIGS